ncbi:MAG: hypothetical protein OEU26_14475 [Candidatus Tectomicrobia bacterium]|nr:hypothetical protein [Candidatus Tectomicrobia bacterium]
MTQNGSSASTYELADDMDAIEFYFEQGLTDGLPVVPPTEARVQRMLQATTRSADEVIALVPPNFGEASVEKIAVNAVMAGCKPDYLPVVMASMEAMCDERVSLHGVQGTTHTSTPLFIINGPIRKQLDINCAAGVFGSGWRANATIGRALRLMMVNLGGARPGEIDKSCMGHPGKFSFCIGEYEEMNPWEPLHVERGFAPDESTVSVYCCDAPQCLTNNAGRSAQSILRTIGAAMATGWNDKTMLAGSYMLVMSPEHARTIADNGLSKQDVKRFLYEHVRRPLGELVPTPYDEEGFDPARLPAWLDGANPATLVPKVASPDAIILIVAGGTAGRFTLQMTGWGGGSGTQLVTVPIRD